MSFFPELRTERLLLRKLKETDADTIFFLRSDAEVNKYIKRTPSQNMGEAVKFINMVNDNFSGNKSIHWGIVFAEILAGTICLWNFSKDKKTAELGYDLHPNFQGKGIMSEAVKAVLNFGFKQLNFEKIEAFTDHRNTKSIKLLQKNGFRSFT